MSRTCCCCCRKQGNGSVHLHNFDRVPSQDQNFLLEDFDVDIEKDSLYTSEQCLLTSSPEMVNQSQQDMVSGQEVGGGKGTENGKKKNELTSKTKGHPTAYRPVFRLSTLNLPSTKYSAVRALLFTLSALFGELPEEYALQMDKSFYEVGGNAQNTLVAIVCLKHYKYKIDVLEFLKAESLRQIVMTMSRVGDHETRMHWNELEKLYSHRPMKTCDLDFLLGCFTAEKIKDPGERRADWISMWKQAVKRGNYILFTKNSDKSPIGVSMNFDINDSTDNHLSTLLSGKSLTNNDIQQLSFQMSSKSVLIELLQFVGENIHKKGKIFHPMFFTKAGLQEQELVAIMIFMEKQNLRLARKKKFKWIVTSHPKLLQAIERQIMGFEILQDTSIEAAYLIDQYRYVIAAKKI